MGLVEDKVIKNHFASEFVFNKYKDLKTCDIIERDPQGKPLACAAGLGSNGWEKAAQWSGAHGAVANRAFATDC